MPVPDADLLAAFDGAVAVFAALPHDRWDDPVAACPGWTLGALVGHLAGVQGWAAGIVTTRPAERPPRSPDPGPGTDRRARLADAAAALREALAGADLDAPIWTFTGTRPTRWWLRRQTHEAVVHALDAADTVGASHSPAAAVAADGVDEALGELIIRRFDHGAFGAPGATAHLHATDTPGEWLVRIGDGVLEVTAEHAKGDVAARGPAADLLRLVWGRAPGPDLEVLGDADVLARFRTASSL